jgi:hypothetical protein
MDGNVDSWKIAHVAGVEPDPQNSYYESKGVSGMYRSGRNSGVRACRWSSHYWSTSGHACCDLWKSCRADLGPTERVWSRTLQLSICVVFRANFKDKRCRGIVPTLYYNPTVRSGSSYFICFPRGSLSSGAS